jgi:hypothetical protein
MMSKLTHFAIFARRFSGSSAMDVDPFRWLKVGTNLGVVSMNDEASDKAFKIVVSFTQQQWQLIDRLKAEGRWGTTREEIVHNLFRDYVKQELGE